MKRKRLVYASICFFIFVSFVLSMALTEETTAKDVGAFIPGKGWVKQEGNCLGDSTPLQFIPKTPADEVPLEDELKKYPICVHCGMNRGMWHQSRHLVHYDDGLAVGTCSIRCLAVNLSLNLDRGVKAIWVADYADSGKPKKMVNADLATYLVGSSLKGTMTMNSKMAFASEKAAADVKAAGGGSLVSFDSALLSAYQDMAQDTIMIRKRRAEKQKKMMKKMAQ